MLPKPLFSALNCGKKNLCISALALLPAISFANMGNSPSTYGLLPTDIASAQAMSIFNSQTSAVYYNPAALAQDERGELNLGMLHADHDLKANGKTIYNSPSQQVQIGMKTDLSDLTDSHHPIYFAFMAGVKKIISALSFSQKSGYILGFKIETGIREEFDVLRYSEESILNIELKSARPSKGLESVRNQLLRHKYLLGILDKEVNVF